MKKNIIYKIAVLATVLFSSCAKLDVENLNNPDINGVRTSAEGIEVIASGLFFQWFEYEQYNIGSPGPAMWMMADWGTGTWANYATRDMSWEPRQSLNNDPAYAYHAITRNFFRAMYSANSNANDVIGAINGGVKIIDENGVDNTKVSLAIGYLVQGLSQGYIGLVFDKGYVTDENTKSEEFANLKATSYKQSIAQGVKSLESAIAICEADEFDVPAGWIGDNIFSSKELARIAHSYAARLLVNSARNISDNNSTDWAMVKNHAEKGIDSDFNIFAAKGISDKGIWISYYKKYMFNWGKVDMRIVNMLDPAQPNHWPEEENPTLPNGGKIVSEDTRATSDFKEDIINSRPDRGLYRYSSYKYSRLKDLFNADMQGDVIMMRKAENDLMLAEAELMIGNTSVAADIINSGTRISRGNLSFIVGTKEVVEDAIFYERQIELPLTGMGIEYFDMRRRNMLQAGSLLHFPVPAQQNLTIELENPYYTFGGVSPQYGVPGVDVAVGGWYKSAE